MPTWDAKQYLRFNEERTRPCHDLVARVAVANPQRVIDLGCGPGNSTAVLATRWPKAELTGLDNSPEMLAAARSSNPGLDWRVGDIAAWAEENGPAYDVVFSNAALQWVDNHSALLPRLLHRVAPGGALAIQMPGNYDAPAYVIMRDMAASQSWCGCFPQGVRNWHIQDFEIYHAVLATKASVLDFWATDYIHIMPDAAAIVEWYKGTGLRPFLDALPNDQMRADFTAEYLSHIRRAYPHCSGGRLLFPFRRIFLIAYQHAASA